MVCLKGQPWEEHVSAANTHHLSTLQVELVGGDSVPPVIIPASLLVPLVSPDARLLMLSSCCPCLAPITIIIPFTNGPTLLMVKQLICQRKIDNIAGEGCAKKILDDVQAVLAVLCRQITVNNVDDDDVTPDQSCRCKRKLETIVEMKEPRKEQQHELQQGQQEELLQEPLEEQHQYELQHNQQDELLQEQHHEQQHELHHELHQEKQKLQHQEKQQLQPQKKQQLQHQDKQQEKQCEQHQEQQQKPTDESHQSHQEDGPFCNLRKRRTPFCRPDESAHSDDEFENGSHRRKTKSPMNIHEKESVATDQPSDDADMMNECLEEVLIDCAEHANRKNVSPKDIKLARLIRYGL